MTKLYQSHCVFPTPDIELTSKFYTEKMGFRAVSYLDAKEPHICLYRDNTEIILTKSNGQRVIPNRDLYGYGEDAYFITDRQEELENEFSSKGVIIARPLTITDYHNREFVIEDIDGRCLAFGIKEGWEKASTNWEIFNMGKIGFVGFGNMGGISEEGVKVLNSRLPAVFDEMLAVTMNKGQKSKQLMREQYGLEEFW
jgi:catechol 2,3-dioxygenase-like lactoylglutathione lyase family enzyme